MSEKEPNEVRIKTLEKEVKSLNEFIVCMYNVLCDKNSPTNLTFSHPNTRNSMLDELKKNIKNK